MKTGSTNFLLQLQKDTTTLCRLWRITPKAGTTFYFTDHDKDIVYAAHTYIADPSFEASAIDNSQGTGKTNFEITVLLGTSITKQDVERGLYSGAAVELDAIFYDHIDYGVMAMATGLVVDCSIPYKSQATLSCQGFASTAQHYLTELYQPTCRAEFCDARCGLVEDDFAESIEIDTVASIMAFTLVDAPTLVDTTGYNLGYITWLTGANTGIKSDIQSVIGQGVRLLIRPPFQIVAGDTGRMVQGCDKTLAACVGRFSNIVNYRGEPFLPGADFQQYPAKKVPAPAAAAVATPQPLPDGVFFG